MYSKKFSEDRCRLKHEPGSRSAVTSVLIRKLIRNNSKWKKKVGIYDIIMRYLNDND